MLKFRINQDKFLNKNNEVSISDFELIPLLGELGETKSLLVCYCDSLDGVVAGGKLLSENIVPVTHTTYKDEDQEYTFFRTEIVSGVNEEDMCFTIHLDKFYDLSLISLSLQLIDSTPYVYIYFDPTHYFSDPSMVEVEKIRLYMDYYNLNGALETLELPNSCEYINHNTIRFPYSDLPNDLSIILFERSSEQEVTENVDGNIRTVRLYRDSFLFTKRANFHIYYDRPLQIVKLPVSQMFATNMYQSDALLSQFVDSEKEKAINNNPDLEKDVYHPVIWDSSSGVKLQDVYKIIFNFHFREHRGDDWTVSSDSHWNGTRGGMRGSYMSTELMNGSSEEEYGYFSYIERENEAVLRDESYQSDLLSYLDFSNDDVHYQKNKLKKSFLRIGFYDSTNSSNQNLLCYSTIFVDSGMLFSRYTKHVTDDTYSMNVYDDNTYDYVQTKLPMTGIRVNREPYGDIITWALDNEETIEDARLSSQLVVDDKYNSSSSSEGFYLYIWHDNESALPQDIYMKAEYNHAGHGRTIPMMVPFFDQNKGEGQGIKTFDEIIEDWNLADKNGNLKDGTVGYGIQTYLKYSYIHFKYRYDTENKQHVYYLDDEFYGANNLSVAKDNTLIINLYEAKIGELSADDGDATALCYDPNDPMQVELSYVKIPASGGTVAPSLSFTLHMYKCGTDEIAMTLTETNSVGTITYTGCSSVNSSSGYVTADANKSTTERTICDNVTVTVVVNGQTGTATATVVQRASDVEVYTYSDLTITLGYDTIAAAGGTVNPQVNYSYVKTDGNGNSTTITGTTSTEEVQLTYSGTMSVVNPSSGSVTTGENESPNQLTIDVVTVTMTVGDMSATATATVYQEAAEVECEYGDIVIELYYPEMPNTGGYIDPTYSYSQSYTCTDGSSGVLTDGGDCTFTFSPNASADSSPSLDSSSTGRITANGTSSETDQTLGEVTLTVEMNGKKDSITVTITQEAKSEVVIYYDDPVVTLEYPEMSKEGGTVRPTYSYSQYWYDSDGNSGYITSGGSLAFSFEKDSSCTTNPTMATATGYVSADANTVKQEQTLGEVTLTVTINGKTGSATATIVQEAASAEIGVGSVAIYDQTEGEVILVDVDDLGSYTDSRYTPIGVVVIPADHNVWGNGKWGIISLVEMDYQNPDNGIVGYRPMCWGQANTDIGLDNLTAVAKVDNVGTDTSITGVDIDIYMPSDKFNTRSGAVQSPIDTKAYYYSNPSKGGSVSPYGENDSRFAGYYQTTYPSTEMNSLADFDGKYNTSEIIAVATAQSNWRSASQIENSDERGYSPAACCCWRYYTKGTNESDWYLPSMGELGYVFSRFTTINDTIQKINEIYGNVAIELHSTNYYWSSAEYDYNGALSIVFEMGNCTYDGKGYNNNVRAFCQV